MHSNGFVHRDLKLENILLSTRDTYLPIPARIKLADFGFICRADGQRLTLQCGAFASAFPFCFFSSTPRQERPRIGLPKSSTHRQSSRKPRAILSAFL
jgi:serine/threonine protein kinase